MYMLRIKYAVALLLISHCTIAQLNQKLVCAGCKVDPYHYSVQKKGVYTHAAVASAHPLASMVGAAIMEAGGNAFDGAIATQLALAVVYPNAGNIGGGGFMVARTKTGKTIALDFRETAPLKASQNMYLDSAGNAQTTLSQNGHLAAGVPGTVAGICQILRFARFPLKQLIQPAIDLAANGYVITERESRALNGVRAMLVANSTRPSAYVKSTLWKGGDTLVNTALANTLTRIRDKGQKGFYEGETAALIVAEMQRGKGLISLEDLKQYQAKFRNPISFDFQGYTIIGMPPPSSGGILIQQMMQMIAEKNLGRHPFLSTPSVQLMVEVERRAFADRAAHMGDPDFWKVPQQTLTSKAYLAERMKDYDSTRATPSSSIQAGIVKESNETTHLSVLDAAGNMVSITTTLNGSYGSQTVVGDAGFLLNNEMDDFSVKPNVPNMYGAVGGAANAIAPKKRMLSSMSPTLVLKNKQPYIVVGTPGGTTIPTSVFQSLVNLLVYQMSPEDAVNQPKFHHQWLPDQVDYEQNFPKTTMDGLIKMGYHLNNKYQIGRVELIQQKAGKLHAVADGRGDDGTAGF